jgi:Ni/Co efflux regulator RcnB
MTRLILATAGAVMLGAPLALAANAATTPTMHAKATKTPADMSERCTTLDAQFQKMEVTHTDKTAKYYQDASALYREGATMCKSNKQTAGVRYLNSAVKILEAHSKS